MVRSVNAWWIFGLQFCFDGWLFFLDGCGFAFFFPSYSGLDQPPVSAWLRFFFFLQWLVVFVVVGCDFGGCTLSFFFSFPPVGGCGCHGGVVTLGGGGYGGLWLLQWWLWKVERW